jgi:probable HAF family extracellular repeat protein
MIPQTALIRAKEGLLMKRCIPTHRYQLESLEPRRLLTTYTVDLGMLPGGVTSEPSDINASGQVVGTTRMDDGSAHAFIWRNACDAWARWAVIAAHRGRPGRRADEQQRSSLHVL